jgi:hypothetical protein
VGSTIVGVAAASVTYFVSFGALAWRRHRRAVREANDARATLQARDRLGAASGVPNGREPAA